MFKSIKELLAICDAESLTIHEVMMRQEMSVTGLTKEEVYARMDKKFTDDGTCFRARSYG